MIDSTTETPEIVTAMPPRREVPLDAVAALPQQVPTETLPVPAAVPLPPVLANARVPSSAAEAFGDVAPLSSDEQDALTAMIDTTVGEGDAEEVQVASVDSDIVPAPVTTRKALVRAAAAAPARALAPAPQKATAKASGWIIQIGAVESKQAAAALLNRARSKGGAALASADPVTEVFSKGNQTYVRARFSGFDNEKQAIRACAALKKNAFNCYTMRL